MVKRKRTSPRTKPPDTRSKQATTSTSRLFSLSNELRFIIWKTVVADPILLFPTDARNKAPAQITAVRSVALDSDDREYACDEDHQCPVSVRRTEPRKTGPLSWMRANRQVYTEALPLVYANMSLHICDPMVLRALLKRISKLEPTSIRSLSICLKVKIERGDQGVFTFAHSTDHGGHLWSGHRACCCWWCSATRRLPQGGEAMDLEFPALKELRLRVCFTCQENQGNDRPSSSRAEDPSCLTWMEEEGSVQSLVDHLSEQMPLRLFKGGREKRVEVRFAVNSIQHNPMNKCPLPNAPCWCTSRCLDEATLPAALFTRLIRASLSPGDV